MSYFAVSVANSIIKLAKERGVTDLTPMKLQRLMYFAQFWYVKNFNKFLINDWFSRWEFGPVIPSIYHQLKYYGSNPVSSYIWLLSANNEAIVYMMGNNPAAWNFLNEILDIYGNLDGFELSAITQRDSSAWSSGRSGTAITKQDMLDAKC